MVRAIVPAADKKVHTAFTLSPSSITIIDEMRGQMSRSSFVDNLIQLDGKRVDLI